MTLLVILSKICGRNSTNSIQTLPEIEIKRTLPNSFYETSIFIIPRLPKNENYSIIFLMNIDAIILNKILPNKFNNI